MDAVLALLPLCAAVKINVLHIHLTDDQGWRYESRQYPELNADASTGDWPDSVPDADEYSRFRDDDPGSDRGAAVPSGRGAELLQDGR